MRLLRDGLTCRAQLTQLPPRREGEPTLWAIGIDGESPLKRREHVGPDGGAGHGGPAERRGAAEPGEVGGGGAERSIAGGPGGLLPEYEGGQQTKVALFKPP